MTERRYRLAAPGDAVARAVAAGGPPPVEPTRTLVATEWELPEARLDVLPQLRRWLTEHGVTGVTEAGMRGDAEPLAPGTAYTLAGAGWSQWPGPRLTSGTPCARCGLPVTHLHAEAVAAADAAAVATVGEEMGVARLRFLLPDAVWVAEADLVTGLVEAGLASGLRAVPLGGDERIAVLSSDAALGGPLYPFGPEPCPLCGRASEPTPRGPAFVRPRYAFELSVPTPAADWSWCTVYGSCQPLVTPDVAAWLLGEEPSLRFTAHGGPDDTDAFLAEQWR